MLPLIELGEEILQQVWHSRLQRWEHIPDPKLDFYYCVFHAEEIRKRSATASLEEASELHVAQRWKESDV